MIPEDTISMENEIFHIDQSGTESELKINEGDRIRFKYQEVQYIGKVFKINHDIVSIKEWRKL